MKQNARNLTNGLYTAVLGLFLAVGSRPVRGQNLIMNPGFEEGLARWTTYHDRDFFRISEDRPRSGARCLDISGRPGNPYNEWVVLMNRELPVKSGHMYRLRFFYRSEGRDEKGKGFAVGVKPGETIAAFRLDQKNWQESLTTFTARSDTAVQGLYLITYNLKEDDHVYFDDISMELLIPPSPSKERKEYVPDEHTLLLSHFNSSAGADFQRGASAFQAGMPSLTSDSSGFVGEGLWAVSKPWPGGFPFTCVSYPSQGNIPDGEGSLEWWMCAVQPLNADDKRERRIFTSRSGNGTPTSETGISLRGTEVVLSIRSNTDESSGQITSDAGYWKAGEWHHLAVCWKDETVGVFMDGSLMGLSHIPGGPFFRGGEMTIGNCRFYPWIGAERKPFEGILDEFRISDIVRWSLER